MNTESVSGWLDAMGVPAEVVSIGREADNTWCLLREEVDGQPGWEVFWREQGNRYDWARFTSEHVACFYLFGRLTWTQALRGVVGPLDANATPPGGIPVAPGQVQEHPDAAARPPASGPPGNPAAGRPSRPGPAVPGQPPGSPGGA